MSAKDARALLRAARTATLATTFDDGSPFATLVAVTDDGSGRPLLLLSGLAEHTKHLQLRPKASLLVTGPGAPDSLDRPRLTLSGPLTWLEGAEADAARAAFLTTHPEAKVWVTLKDFAPARLEPAALRWVGGFARAAHLSLEAWRAG